jgi:hypothetical protein
MIKKFLFASILMLVCVVGSYAQNAATPYSIYGIGKIHGYGLTYNKNMGGLGLSIGKPWILNNINPAMLPLNDFSTFDAGIYAENRILTTSALSQSNTNGGLNYLTLGFPIKTRTWTMSFGLMPYSNVSYNVIASAPVVNREEAIASYQYEGNGGINQVYMGNGWQIVPGVLYLGARVGYAFGSITNETLIDIEEQSFRIVGEDTIVTSKDFRSSNFYRSTRYSDFLIEGGLYMKRRIGEELDVNLGLVYELSANMRTKRDEKITVVDRLNPNPPTDDILTESEGKTVLPAKYGLGLSLSKEFKWSFGVDFYTRDWSKFKSDFENDESLTNSFKIVAGGEFTPDFFSATSYIKRVAYQIGFNYERTPVEINNINIDDFGINFGVSLPVGLASILNVGLNYGQLGTTKDGLIRENYIKFNLGMTFNDRSFGWYRNQRKLK